MGIIYKSYDVPKPLLNKEMEDRQHLLHTLSTVDLMEKYVQKVEKISEHERATHQLCPKSGQGITKRLLVNVKYDTII